MYGEQESGVSGAFHNGTDNNLSHTVIIAVVQVRKGEEGAGGEESRCSFVVGSFEIVLVKCSHDSEHLVLLFVYECGIRIHGHYSVPVSFLCGSDDGSLSIRG